MKPYLWVAALQLLGALAAILALRGRHLVFATAAGLPFGLALHALLALAPLLLRYAFGSGPLYRPTEMAVAVLGWVALLALGVVRLVPFWECTLGRIAFAQLVGLALLLAATAAALDWNVAILAVDSFEHIERGLALARVGDLRWMDLSELGAWPILPQLLHASTELAGVEYLYFLPPVLSLGILATLAVATFDGICVLGRSRIAAFTATLLGMAWLCSCYFVAFNTVFVHVNWIAAAYVLLFLVCAWRSLVSREPGFLPLAALAASAFVLSRVEGPLFLALFLCLLALEGGEGRNRIRTALALALFPALWCGIVAGIVGDEGRFAGAGRLAVMAGGLVASVALAASMQLPGVRQRAGLLAGAGIATLAAVFGLMVLLRPEHMLGHTMIWIRNAALLGKWATGWILPAALALASPLLGRIPHERFLVLGILGFVLLSLDLTWFGTWRPGWFDSGNRMLLHVLPATAWLLMLKAAAIVPRSA